MAGLNWLPHLLLWTVGQTAFAIASAYGVTESNLFLLSVSLELVDSLETAYAKRPKYNDMRDAPTHNGRPQTLHSPAPFRV